MSEMTIWNQHVSENETMLRSRWQTIQQNFLPSDSTPGEMDMFFEIARATGANPFLREIYMTKYNSKDGPKVAIFHGVDYYKKIGTEQPDFNGIEQDSICENDIFKKTVDGYIHEYESFKDRGAPVGGYCKIWRKGIDRPFVKVVKFSEYSKQALWNQKPETMIAKVAESQCWRKAYPDKFGGSYTQDEAWVGETVINPEPEKRITDSEVIQNRVNLDVLEAEIRRCLQFPEKESIGRELEIVLMWWRDHKADIIETQNQKAYGTGRGAIDAAFKAAGFTKEEIKAIGDKPENHPEPSGENQAEIVQEEEEPQLGLLPAGKIEVGKK